MRQGENVVASELGSGQFDASARSWDWGWEQAEWRATGTGKVLQAEAAPSVKFIGIEGDRVVYEVGSGRYQFRVANSRIANGK